MPKTGPRADKGDRLAWKCANIDCLHDLRCKEKVMFADDGYTQIRGTIAWNPDDGKWDWCVSVDHYGSDAKPLWEIERIAGRHARRMASQVGMLFRGPKIAALPGLEDED